MVALTMFGYMYGTCTVISQLARIRYRQACLIAARRILPCHDLACRILPRLLPPGGPQKSSRALPRDSKRAAEFRAAGLRGDELQLTSDMGRVKYKCF